MAESNRTTRRGNVRPRDPEPRSIIELIRDGTLDAELAAHLWLLVGGRVPVIVAAGPQGAGKTTLLRAVLDLLPADVGIVELAGEDERFEWLPQASELGWPGVAHAPAGHDPVRPETTVLLASELSNHTPAYTWDAAARVFVRAASIGYGLAATIHADTILVVLGLLRSRPVRATDDELSRLGVVLVLRRTAVGRRVAAAHYIRPVARDGHGHVQRLGPAVLATWDERTDGFEHFGWGIIPELARRIGLKPGDYEAEHDRRRDRLESMVANGPVESDAVRAALRDDLAAAVFDAPRSDA
jgi:energy-coupling factor transporter ATP-binding protein EcfA2